MDPKLIGGLKNKNSKASASQQGFRVLAVARKELPGRRTCSKDDERDLILKGFAAFLGLPKKTAGPAIEALHKHGVAVKILTVDNVITRSLSRKTLEQIQPGSPKSRKRVQILFSYLMDTWHFRFSYQTARRIARLR